MTILDAMALGACALAAGAFGQTEKHMADRQTYLHDICAIMAAEWPGNRTVNIVCHGHSVPAGYFKTPVVDTFNAYPFLPPAGCAPAGPWAGTAGPRWPTAPK